MQSPQRFCPFFTLLPSVCVCSALCSPVCSGPHFAFLIRLWPAHASDCCSSSSSRRKLVASTVPQTCAPAPRITDPDQIRRDYAFFRPRILLWTTIGYAAFYFVRKNLSMAMPVMEEHLGHRQSQPRHLPHAARRRLRYLEVRQRHPWRSRRWSQIHGPRPGSLRCPQCLLRLQHLDHCLRHHLDDQRLFPRHGLSSLRPTPGALVLAERTRHKNGLLECLAFPRAAPAF